jgi:hypothetical protein
MIKTRYLGAELQYVKRRGENDWVACYYRFPLPGRTITFLGSAHSPEAALAVAQKKIKLTDAERSGRNDVVAGR